MPNFKLSRRDIQPFIYPYDNEIEAIGIRGLYLSNYIRWDSKQQHEKMIEKNASKEDYYNSQSEGKEFDKNSQEKESNT